jgi:hypothetical protein
MSSPPAVFCYESPLFFAFLGSALGRCSAFFARATVSFSPSPLPMPPETVLKQAMKEDVKLK